MIIAIENARICYEEIIKKVKKSNGKVVIFLGFDIDSLCTLRILVALLRADNVRYEIIPVMNFNQLDLKLEEFKKSYNNFPIDASQPSSKDIKAFVMINCGGTRDMTKNWFCDDSLDILCLLIDVHRPSHHNNIQSERSIILINDDFYEMENCPKDEDLLELQNGEEDDEDDEDEENIYTNNYNKERDKESNKESNMVLNEDKNADEDEDGNEHDETNKIKLKKEEDNNNNNDDDDDEDYSKEGIKIDTAPIKRKIKKKKENLDTIEEENNIDDENNDDIDKLVDGVRAKKSKKSAIQAEKLIKRKIRNRKLNMIKNYYSGNYFGFPAAYIAYKMASLLHREDNQTLWLLIISITEHYIQSHISQKMYDILYKECHSDVLRLNGHKNLSNNSSNNLFVRRMKKEENEEENKLSNNNNNIVVNEDKEKDKHDFSDVKVKSSNKEVKTILLDPDYRLCLYRHWNIFDSFVYSNYTLGRLQTWKEHGKEDIKKLLTFIGIPLEEAKQKYTYMKNEYKTLFKEKIMEVGNRFGLKDFIFYSFVYQLDQKTQLSASDFVYCLTSLIDYPFNLKNIEGNEYFQDLEDPDTSTTTNTNTNSNSNSNSNSTESSNFVENSDTTDKENNINYSNEEKQMKAQYKYDTFWACYDFLSFKNTKVVKTLIDLSIKFQTVLVNYGTSLIDKRSLQGSKNFRYVTITTFVDEQNYFFNAISLEKLALFIMETDLIINIHNSNHTVKPFVLALPNKNNKTFIVAGVLGTSRSYDSEKNQFAMRFRVSANKIGANLMLNNFDDCIIEIPKEDYFAFLDEICKD